MFGVAKLFSSFDDIKHGNTAKTNLKLMDLLPLQHMHLPDGVNVLNKISLAQTFCTPFANCDSNNPSNGRYVATCSNYPDFAVSWKDSKNVTSYLVGMKVRVRFQYGITYGSVSAGTYPYLNINSSGAFPMLAQGKPMATGAISAGQTVELTLIPYGSSYAWDADSNVRESTDDYVIYTDGTTVYNSRIIIRKYSYSKYLKVTFSSFLASTLGSIGFIILSRGATYLINVGSGSYTGINVSKSGAKMADYYTPTVYLKSLTTNEPIYIDNASGLAVEAIVMSQNANIAKIEAVDSLPSGYTGY